MYNKEMSEKIARNFCILSGNCDIYGSFTSDEVANEWLKGDNMKELVRGSEVFVRDSIDSEWSSEIYLYLTEIKGANYPILVVNANYNEEFKNGEGFKVEEFEYVTSAICEPFEEFDNDWINVQITKKSNQENFTIVGRSNWYVRGMHVKIRNNHNFVFDVTLDELCKTYVFSNGLKFGKYETK